MLFLVTLSAGVCTCNFFLLKLRNDLDFGSERGRKYKDFVSYDVRRRFCHLVIETHTHTVKVTVLLPSIVFVEFFFFFLV